MRLANVAGFLRKGECAFALCQAFMLTRPRDCQGVAVDPPSVSLWIYLLYHSRHGAAPKPPPPHIVRSRRAAARRLQATGRALPRAPETAAPREKRRQARNRIDGDRTLEHGISLRDDPRHSTSPGIYGIRQRRDVTRDPGNRHVELAGLTGPDTRSEGSLKRAHRPDGFLRRARFEIRTSVEDSPRQPGASSDQPRGQEPAGAERNHRTDSGRRERPDRLRAASPPSCTPTARAPARNRSR